MESMKCSREFFPCGILPLGANASRRLSAPTEGPEGYFPCGILPLRVDTSGRLWEPSGNFPQWDSSPGARRFPALMGALRGFSPVGRRFPALIGALGEISPMGFSSRGQTLPGTYGNPQGIFPLWDSPLVGRCFPALMGPKAHIVHMGAHHRVHDPSCIPSLCLNGIRSLIVSE
jgi:hypothetical protein